MVCCPLDPQQRGFYSKRQQVRAEASEIEEAEAAAKEMLQKASSRSAGAPVCLGATSALAAL